MRNWSTIYYTPLYYTACTCFDAIAPILHSHTYVTYQVLTAISLKMTQ